MPKKNQAAVAQEKRLKRWRSKCPQKVAERIGRANSEDFRILKQGAIHKHQCKFKIAGSTGNVYDVKIGKLPSCTCPDFQKREDACKHTLFVLLKMLDLDDELLYQKAFTSEELTRMFEQLEPSDGDDDDIDDLIQNFADTTVEEDPRGRFEYNNVRRITGQPSDRDRSTYRPFHWEKPPYRRYN